jgi:hypothetical protein
MKSDSFGPRVAALFAVVVVVYFAVFTWIEHRRHLKGPWVVSFAEERGTPVLVVSQKYLGISDCRIRFPGGTVTNQNLPQTVAFDSPTTIAPFGNIPFSDLTFLPGTVTIKLCGHTVELIPRVLGIDGKEHAWFSGSTLDLPARPDPPATTNAYGRRQ